MRLGQCNAVSTGRSTALLVCLILSALAHAEVVNPTVAYDVPPASIVAVNPMIAKTISMRGLGAEETGATRVENCTFINNEANFTALPAQYRLDVTQSTGAISVQCTNSSSSLSAILRCLESANPGNDDTPTTRAWLVQCNNLANEDPTRLAYAPNPGTTMRANGVPLAGAAAQVNLEVRFVPGFASPANGTLTSCQISGKNAGDFSPAPPDTVISQAPITFPLNCVRGTEIKTAELRCQETIGNASVARSWPLRCPAGDIRLFFNGFESEF